MGPRNKCGDDRRGGYSRVNERWSYGGSYGDAAFNYLKAIGQAMRQPLFAPLELRRALSLLIPELRELR